MTLYLLENSVSKQFYIGVTDNMARRLIEHNDTNTHFTGKIDGEWKIIGRKELEVNMAYREEKGLKKAKNKSYILWYFTEGR